MQKMQSELAMMKNNLHPFASTTNAPNAGNAMEDNLDGSGHSTPMMISDASQNNSNNMALATSSSSDQPVTWKLSLSPSGLRIDTNIASVADLYRILLNGISQLNINNDSTTSLFNPESPSFNNNSSRDSSSTSSNMRRQQQQQQHLHQSKSSTTGVGAAGRRNGGGSSGGGANYLDTSNNSGMIESEKGGRLWEVDDNEARKILQEKKSGDDTLPKDVLDKLMHSCYHTCFLAYQIVDKDAFIHQYMSDEGLDPLLTNSINAWVSKHGCIYHHANGGSSGNTTMGEVYFKNARQLLKKCFDISSPTTIHALLNLYMYQLSSERSSLAYLYIGLAIRMAQDLKFHKKEHMSADLNQRETNKRLWWSAYWLDLCAALESNRPTMVDDKDCDLDYPVRLEHEDDETGYRIHFAVYSIKLMRIRKDITKHLPSEQSGQSLLSAISRLENALTNWMAELPQELHFDDHSTVFQTTGSFRDEACLILNIQYQTTWIMLHKFFLPKQDQTATPVALLSLNICTKSANLITRMLTFYSENLNWCQFFYAMDGIIASVTIHQVNALSSEKEVSYLAQRNLIITASVLKNSPLMYMVKVCEIIESIEGFLKKNGLSSDLGELPVVNEDSINQQSISSVFHPAVFESQHMMQTQQQQQVPPPPPQQQQQQQQHHPHHHQHHPSYTSDSLSPSIQSQHTVGMMSSPQSQHSSATIRVPSQLSSAMFQQQQQQAPPQSHTPQQPAGVNAAGQQQSQQHPHSQQQMLKQQQQQQQQPSDSSLYDNSNIMVEPSMLFNDPAGLMGFNMATGPQAGDMDQLLLRNMGFDLNSNGPATPGNDGRMYTMFDSGNRSTATTNTTTTSTPNTSNNNTSSNSFVSSATSTTPYNVSSEPNTNNNNYGFNTSSNTNNFNNDTTSSVNNNANNTNNSYPNFLNNAELFGIPTNTAQQQQPPQSYHQNPPPFDTTALFGSMNMDPATMSALLYNSPGIPSFATNFPPQGPQQGQGVVSPDDNDLLYGPNNGRKRVHRDWEDPS